MLFLALAYWPLAFKEFIFWDTQDYVIYNQRIQALTPAKVWWMLTSLNQEISYWHPLTWLSHAVDYAFFELRPAGHQLSNLLLHFGNSLWIFLAARMLGAGRKHTGLAALAAALLFAVHPLHVEVVAWIAERKELLCTFFLLPALLAYLNYARAPKGRGYWYGLALICFVLALMSKPMAVTLPALLLVLDFWPLRRLRRGQWRGVMLDKLPFVLLSVLVMGMTVVAQLEAGSISSLGGMEMSTRLLNAFHSLIFYLEKWLLPLRLLPFYPYPVPLPWWPVVLVLALSAGAVWLACRRRPAWLAAWLFFLIALAPVIGIVQTGLQAAADRYTYLSTVPFYLFAGFAVARLPDLPKSWHRIGAATLAGLVLLLVTALTWQQSLVWNNTVSLWRYAVYHTPASAVAHANLATGYTSRGDYPKAVEHFERCVALYGSEENYRKLAVAYRLNGETEKRLGVFRLLLDFHRRAGHRDKLAQGWLDIARLERERGQLDQARAAAREALRYAPAKAEALALLREME